MNALIVEDDKDINQMLKELLSGQGYQATQAFSGTEALFCMERQQAEAAMAEKFDLIVLDLMLPGMPGEEVLARIKERYPKTGVIVASARDDVQSRIALLRAGADDYLVKPFDTQELLARLEAVLRRSRQSRGEQQRSQDEAVLEYKDIRIYPESLKVQVAGEEVSLTKREYLILELMMRHPGKVFTKSNLYQSVWNEEFLGQENAVNVHISNLRQKLAKISPEETYIQTVWGIGFKMK